MAYFRMVRGRCRVEVERVGAPRESKTFDTKAEARSWAQAREVALRDGAASQYSRFTVREALQKYAQEVSPKKGGRRWEEFRLAAFERQLGEDADKACGEFTTAELAAWRDQRLKTVSPGTCQREINLLRNVFTIAREEWKWLGHDPFKGLRAPGDNPPRVRRVLPGEVKRICRWLGYRTGDVRTKQQEVALAFLVALRNAMRSGEILSLSDANVNFDTRVATVRHKMQYRTKRPREVPLTRQTIRLLGAVKGRGQFFTVDDASRDALFRKARDSLLIEDLHFHDARGEALTRLASRRVGKVDVMTLSRISGIKDLRLLMRVYYRESAADIAARM